MKSCSQASLGNLESEFDSNHPEDKAGIISQQHSLSHLKYDRQRSSEPAPDPPADAPRTKASDWKKSSVEAKPSKPGRKKDPQPFQLAASVQTSDNLHLPEQKKKIRISEDVRDKEQLSAEPMDAEKVRLPPVSPDSKGKSPKQLAAANRFIITALESEGLVRNPSAWHANRLLLAESPRPGRSPHSHPQKTPDRLSEAAAGKEQGKTGLPSQNLLEEVEAAQKQLLEEMLLGGPGPAVGPGPAQAGLDLASIERQQQQLLDEMFGGPPDRLPTVVSLADSPDRPTPQPAGLAQLEAEQMKLLAEMMGEGSSQESRVGPVLDRSEQLERPAAADSSLA